MNSKLLFSLRLLKHLALFLGITLPLQLIGIVLLIPTTLLYDIGKLPKVLRWYDSADPFVNRDTSVIESINKGTSSYYPHTTNRLVLAFHKYCWLAFRNPLNYFEYIHLGVKADLLFPSYIKRTYINPTDTGKDIGDHFGDAPGYEYIETRIGNNYYYEYYAIIPINYPFLKNKAIRFRMGHKLSGSRVGNWIQHAFVFNPIQPINYNLN